MKKLKGVKPINKYLNNWLKQHDFECTVEIGTDFSYDFTNDILTYTIVVPEDHDNYFIDVCKECRDEISNVDTFILSFFHELGHFETQSIFEEDDWIKYETLCKEIQSKSDIELSDYIRYWHSDIELEATQWGCDYIVEHSKDIEKWWNDLQPLILNFMKLNDIQNT